MHQDNIFYTGSLYQITASEGNDKGVICGEYNSITRKFTYGTTRVVMSQKEIIPIDASDENSILEMINLNRENTNILYNVQQMRERRS